MSGLIDETKQVFDLMNGTTSTSVIDAAKQFFDNGGSINPNVNTLSIASGVLTIDCSKTYHKLPASNFTSNVTSVALTNVATTGKVTEFSLDMQQDATGGRTFALPSSFKSVGSSDTAIQSAANAKTRLIATTLDGGTTWEYVMGAVAA